MRLRVGAAVMAGVLAVTAGVALAWPAARAEYTAEGRVWKEIFYEQFAMQLDASSANCLASEVGAVTRTVGPLLGGRPDDTPGSVWRAVDVCLSEGLQDQTARAIALGGWAFEEPAIAPEWDQAAARLGGCVRAAGGWQSVGSFEAFLATCQSEIKALREGGNGA
ncbi:MAG: hypothetical protein ABMA25_00630 [Ilumatobacteraceae bacterium]